VDGQIASNEILEDSAVRSVGHCGICMCMGLVKGKEWSGSVERARRMSEWS
jgi:hypothetical protein